jgi:hypothetical protein
LSRFSGVAVGLAVGGTDFGDTYAGSNGTYWNSTNTSVYGSAKSYVPEIPWNDSCAGSLLASYFGYSTVELRRNRRMLRSRSWRAPRRPEWSSLDVQRELLAGLPFRRLLELRDRDRIGQRLQSRNGLVGRFPL